MQVNSLDFIADISETC